jgi:heat-inducible transcriptional repressor
VSSDAFPAPELSFRARRVLYAVITEYVAAGEPVGSRRLARRYGLNLSPASIRNVLADLTDAGYVVQPHTSAGRIPTDKGFRLFVDALVQMREVSTEDRAAIASRIRALSAPDDLLRETGRLLSTMTGAAAVVSPPRAEDEAIAQIRFVPLRDDRVLAVIVSRAGNVQNRVVATDGPVDARDLDRAHNYLAELLAAAPRSLAELRDALAADLDAERDVHARARGMIDATLAASDARPSMVIEGQRLLFDRPEFTDVDKLRAYVRTFDDKERLIGLLERTIVSGGVQVLIGSEVRLDDVSDISVVSATFRQGSKGAGTVAIVGPQRMDYGKVVPLVEFTAQVVGQALSGPKPT